MENVGMSATMSLNDQFSPKMKNIEATTRSAQNEFGNLRKASKNLVDNGNIAKASSNMQALSTNAKGATASVNALGGSSALLPVPIGHAAANAALLEANMGAALITTRALVATSNQLPMLVGNMRGASDEFGNMDRLAGLFPGKINSAILKVGALGLALGAVLITMKALVSAAAKLAPLADQTSQTYARYNMMGSSDTGALDEKIQASAQRSRANYMDTASAVSKLSINAGDAFSGGEDEVIAFSETVNKMFALSGTTGTEASAAMLQLTQAMGSGVLRGDELNSIFEQSPIIIQTIADSLGVSVGEIRKLASEGEITADVVKNAILGASDDINEKFEAMPGTFAQIGTVFENIKMQALQPLLSIMTSISDYIMDHTELFYQMGETVGQIFGKIADMFSQAGPALAALGSLLQSAVLAGLNLVLAAMDKLTILGGFVIQVLNKVVSAFFGVMNVAATVGSGIWGVVKTTGQNIVTLAENVKNKVLQMIYSVMAAFVDAKNAVAGFLGMETSDNPYAGKASSYAGAQKGYQEIDRSMFNRNALASAFKEGTDLSKWGGKTASSGTSGLGINASNYKNSPITASGDGEGGSGSGAAKKTADNTSSIADNISAMRNVINEISEMMERQLINSFTSTQVNIDMSNMVNNLSSDMDLDAFQNGIIETITVGTEGVHL